MMLINKVKRKKKAEENKRQTGSSEKDKTNELPLDGGYPTHA